jgi:hypothetical protein
VGVTRRATDNHHPRADCCLTLFVGIGRCLTTLSPPRNRACDFHRTRLLGFTTWSWSLPPQSTTVAAYGYRENPTSTFSQPLGGFSLAVGEVSCPTSAPFRVGYYPIQPVRSSRCLSAAGLCFLRPPFPTEEFGCPCGWLTGDARPHWGYHVPHHRAPTGVGAFYTPGAWCPCSGACVNPWPLPLTVTDLPADPPLDDPKN